MPVFEAEKATEQEKYNGVLGVFNILNPPNLLNVVPPDSPLGLVSISNDETFLEPVLKNP